MKSEINNSIYTKPLIFNCYKPEGESSFDIVRHFKRNLPKGYGKIGHFGTLDPFACGVLMLGVNGAAKLNNFIHDFLPKTYIATGILGQSSETGDLTEGISDEDTSEYLETVIASFDKDFIENTLQEKFLGEYMQAPHKFSAAKHEGKALHKWAREGVEIKKEKKQRFVHKIKVLKYEFPKLIIEFEVSSGTYIRTLFKDCAEHLGTLGTLSNLQRTKVGDCGLDTTISKDNWPKERDWDVESNSIDVRDILKFSKIIFEDKEAKLYTNGVKLKIDRAKEIIPSKLDEYYWVENLKSKLLGLAKIEGAQIVSEFNFPSSST